MTQPPIARLANARVALRPVRADDYAMLRDAELSAPLAFRWRLAGAHPSPESYPNSLWNGVLVQFIVCRKPDSEPIGIASAFDYDAPNGHIHLAAGQLTPGTAVGVMEGALLLLDYLFSGWPIRKVYLDVPAWNMSAVENNLGPGFQEEGRFLQHRFADGRFHDLVVLALYRETWEEERKRFIP